MHTVKGSRGQLLRYLVTGGMNALLTGLVYVFGLYVIQLHYALALIVAFLCGTVFNYIVHFSWVFRPEPRLSFRRRFWKYLSSNSGTFALNLLALYYLVDVLDGDPLLSQALLMIVILTMNFLLAKYWSLRASDPSSESS